MNSEKRESFLKELRALRLYHMSAAEAIDTVLNAEEGDNITLDDVAPARSALKTPRKYRTRHKKHWTQTPLGRRIQIINGKNRWRSMSNAERADLLKAMQKGKRDKKA